jgi:hypothetical protein
MNRRDLVKLFSGAVVAAPVAVNAKPPRFTNRKRYYGRFDYQAYDGPFFEPLEVAYSHRGICLLNGVEVKNCCYANTVTGIVRTYDVLHDGSIATCTVMKYRWPDSNETETADALHADVIDVSAHSTAWPQYIADRLAFGARAQIADEWHKPEDFPGRDVSCPIDGVLCETLHGEVEIWGPEIG